MKTFFPIIGDEKRDKIYRSQMLSWIAIAFIFFLSLYRPDFQWMVNWLILPFVLMMTFIDFSTFLLFKNHVINDDKTIQQSEEFKELFSRDNMKKIMDATENSYYYEVKSISNAITFSILLIPQIGLAGAAVAIFINTVFINLISSVQMRNKYTLNFLEASIRTKLRC